MEPTLLNADALNPDPELLIASTDRKTNDEKEELSNKINKEIDKIFGPAVQRNRSSSDIEIVAPLKHKRRHYWSQEHLFAEKPMQLNSLGDVSNHGLNSFHINELSSIDNPKISSIPVLHENQRAEIVASVTERLYSKLKKNDRIIPKIESVLDKKNLQPLNELKICSNARQRLMELSQKALRNKRRIGIPACTQTKNHVARVKNQGVESQTDLQSLVNCQTRSYCLYQDASIATEAITPRLKEKAVGANYSSLNMSIKDVTTQTDTTSFKNSSTMTEIIKKYDHSTQTQLLQQLNNNNDSSQLRKSTNKIKCINDSNSSPIIKINISPICSFEPYSSEDLSDNDIFSEDEETDSTEESYENSNATTEIMQENNNSGIEVNENIDDFSEEQCLALPHVMVDLTRKVEFKDYEDLILGRNMDSYPYNLRLSPCKQIEESKRVIKFKNSDVAPAKEGIGDKENNIKKKSETFDKDSNNEKNNSLNTAIIELKSPDEGIFIEKEIDVKVLKNDVINFVTDETKSESDKYEDRGRLENKNNILASNHFRRQNKYKDITIDTNIGYHSLNSFFNEENRKRTPTEYLHYLIQKRREAVATDSSIKYTRNVSL